ncbi:MAG TPA: right-handed parallel beta-helix repeat-containing protein [Tepidisphaeraceae bacterium]
MFLSTWYVATTGSDSHPGSLRQPFQTIQQAANVAQPGDTVMIRGGTYRETVVPPRSGADGAPITFEAFRGERVTIDGADPINQWSNGSSGIRQATVAWDLGAGSNQLFYNGQAMTEARWPNTKIGTAALWQPTFAQMSGVTPGPSSGTAATAKISVPQLTDPDGAWVGATIDFAAGNEWVFQSGTVTASLPGSLTFTYTQLLPTDGQTLTDGNRFYLTGTLRALDAPGEWYFDPTTNALSFLPPAGGTPRAGTVEFKHRQFGFDLSRVSYVNITGITLFACTINTDADSTHDTLNGIAAQYVSQSPVEADPWADQFAPHTTGIILNGSNNTIDNSTIHFSSGDGVFLGGNNNTVQNCVIGDVDTIGADEAGVTTLGSNEQVLNNTIFNCGRSGVVSRYTAASTIAHNRIYACGLLTTDLGGIYAFETDGQGTRIEYNKISEIHTVAYRGVGIYLDEGCSNYVVDHNVVWDVDTGVKLNPVSENNLVQNNTFAGSADSVGSGPTGLTGSILANNIFIGPAQIASDATQENNLSDPPSSIFLAPEAGNFQLRRALFMRAIAHANAPTGMNPDVGAFALGQPPFTAGATIRMKGVRLR